QSNIREVKLREVKSSIVKVAKATFDHYILSFSKNKEQYQYTSLRKHKVEQRASELFAITNDIDKTQNLLFLAVDNRRASKFHMGENKEGKKYIDFIDHIFRSQEYTEKLIFEEHKKEIKRPEWMDDMLVKYKKRLEDAGKG
ncbi:MAG: hypothetical protein HQ579_03880, partial [Candidatus Omnitrophica bacterium]|nr:hypothetical protein [Candidatus Omnitrophota bacterium]